MEKAVVIGGGIAGLLSAFVLSNFFRKVILIEKDSPPQGAKTRKGVPQGNHIHVLLNAGENILEDFFPGFRSDLINAGSKTAVLGEDVKWHLNGNWMPFFRGGMTTYFQSRPLLEHVLRARINRIENIEILYQKRFRNFLLGPDGKKFESVIFEDILSKKSENLSGDFFVEASGSGSDYPEQLRKNQFSVPNETIVEPDFAYSSGIFEIPPEWDKLWKAVLLYPKANEETRAGAVVPIEQNKWMITAAGYCGDYPPTDPIEFQEFLQSLQSKEVFEAVSNGKLVGEIRSFKFRHAVRRHFENTAVMPENAIALGDAICRMNPFFGQGIAVTALEAKMLQTVLFAGSQHKQWPNARLPRKFYKEAAKILNVPWEMAIGEDFKYPQTHGKRPFLFPMTRWFKDRVMSANDPDVAKQFYQVMHFVDPPESLLNPKILKRVFFPSSRKGSSR